MIRRYTPLAPSRGTAIPPLVRIAVYDRDKGCVGFDRLPGVCQGPLELDHVRAAHATGMKSSTTVGNLVALCSRHHQYKTLNGKKARPILIEYLEARGATNQSLEDVG